MDESVMKFFKHILYSKDVTAFDRLSERQ